MNLTTTYLGKKLKNPLVASASPLSRSMDNIRRLEDAGASAIVLFSLFEEEILHETRELDHYLGMLAGIAGLSFQSFRALIPNVLYEPPQKFKIGPPTNLAEGMTFFEDKRLYIFKEGKSFYAISAACTYLGCTVKYAKLNQPKQVEIDGEKRNVPFEFHCPCHGSKFYSDGTHYAGPAPRALQWYKLEVSPDDGQVVVDMSSEVEQNFRLTV